MSQIIDTHVHLDFSDFEPDLHRILGDSKLCGVGKFLIPGASLKTLQNAYDLASNHAEIYFAVGIHPCDIDEILPLKDSKDSIESKDNKEFIESKVREDSKNFIESKNRDDFIESKTHGNSKIHHITESINKDSIKLHILELFKPFIESKKCVAVGECGLDFYRLDSLDSTQIKAIKAMQIAIFKAQIEIALEYNLPLILHVRDSKENDEATTNIVTILQEYYKFNNLRGVFHCFNANPKLLAFSDRFYYGIGGILTFKNAQNLVEILPKIPENRILLETDAPFLAPIPHRGKRNEPKYLVHVAEKISQILNITQEKVCEITSQNAEKLFSM
ncbi:TatD family deoxyribonuclease [Helicobacter saguini]|uniref:TatD family deoxyribonuclease n=1 Tax=Helicobacter saguini TaxID=1548018 RepID=A0A347VXX8_9HELI|nr:TatD family hydrolase [Helicobacter saguini]MWV61450.1 TatD family deoxyribonuclease [Helicobacter saguini]MWV67879.1 TatD family deoxyribonuclease [Helicobacter saguini]MWV70652.1 TatD family deoxyribonuclease [Helicobacter saguini]MWV72557.1 TatD family deoxyribonuclease [Helicobacter saguini]TLD94707.1 TatD family deoxyribonuclease [Helicobacter saguini]